jgi:hypothetical protein
MRPIPARFAQHCERRRGTPGLARVPVHQVDMGVRTGRQYFRVQAQWLDWLDDAGLSARIHLRQEGA